MKIKTAQNYTRYLERKALYKRFGYDINRERNFIIDKARPLAGSILEVGTGKGYFTMALAKQFSGRFVSVDVSEEEQACARLNVEYCGFEKRVDFRIENAERLSFDDKSFDLIFSVNMLHHLAHPFKVIDELARVAAVKGKIILSDFSRYGFRVIEKIHRSEGRTHEAGVTGLRDIEKYLSAQGFGIEKKSSKLQDVLIAKR